MSKTDATKKLLGYKYQELIALEMCLNAKPNEIIWIECKGDIADEKRIVETKHHLVQQNITSNSVDVWKTLKNYVEQFEEVKTFSLLILHTTEKATTESIFFNWSNLSVDDKLEKLEQHTPSESISAFHKVVCDAGKDKLRDIISKFKILESQKTIKEQWEHLKNHPTFITIMEENKNSALEYLYGYMTKAAIYNHNAWKIIINDFKKDIQIGLSQFTGSKIKFPIINNNNSNFGKKKFKFIEKMQHILLVKKVQEFAITDYFKANLSQVKMLETSPVLQDNLDLYDQNIARTLEDEKLKQIDQVSKEILNTDKAHEQSRAMYHDCISKNHEEIIGVENTQKYYRNGRIHNSIEDSEFTWMFTLKDFE